jgi:hypothetical protein
MNVGAKACPRPKTVRNQPRTNTKKHENYLFLFRVCLCPFVANLFILSTLRAGTSRRPYIYFCGLSFVCCAKSVLSEDIPHFVHKARVLKIDVLDFGKLF